MSHTLGPSAPVLQPVAPDERFAADGRVRHLAAYDAGRPAEPRCGDGPGADLVTADIDLVIAALRQRLAAVLPERSDLRRILLRHVRTLLGWLQRFPGADWEQRWLASGVDCAPKSWNTRLAAACPGPPTMFSQALAVLLLGRVLRPSYSFLLNAKFGELFKRFPLVHDCDDFARLRALAAYRRAVTRAQIDAEAGLIRVLIRTGKSFGDINADDLLIYADLVKTSGRARREHLLWELLVQAGPLAGEPATLRAVWTAKGNSRQHDAAHVLDRYGIPPSPVREVIIDYLSEIRPGLDYGSWVHHVHTLGRAFWWEILQINPDQADLRLAPHVVAQWRERLAVTAAGGTRRDVHSLLFRVRAFYRDLQQWALDEPARWGVWAAPSPVRDADARAVKKAKRHQKARTQQRTRVLTPLLPKLLAAATARRGWSVRLLAAAEAAGHGETLDLDGMSCQRFDPPTRSERLARCRTWVLRPDGTRFDAGALEADCFWAWALIETLRLTGCRIEEVMELTQLSLRHYTPPTTGAVVPLLHITPSKLDTERLVPMTPELVSVLLAVVRRARGDDERIPLSIRYDRHDRIHGAPLPHLFSRPVGARHEVLSSHYVRTILNATADAAGLSDNGEPIRFTPHDFRRLFTTELVGAGLPIHIAATLLGHLDLDTTRGYTAVFPEQVIHAHRKMVEHRRSLRDSHEYRAVAPEEWADFEQHFQLRRVELGDCFRPYGTPCVHEHACVRCPFLRLDPTQAPRLDIIEASTKDRLAEAHGKQWLGEVAALEESLRHIRNKRSQLEAPTA
ncbi:tyrosine-type recombinase/integrase [Nucisporomicrobium flavum]|uniref:tyrosine-type recombinase/integrase n=1 Tax=Nucisporomicrobium flavum TaxID=2785915 RepID=UPI0018F77F0E|nr:tyrosine-type recombinase/integrase [Nucisporomicrobium flavum]